MIIILHEEKPIPLGPFFLQVLHFDSNDQTDVTITAKKKTIFGVHCSGSITPAIITSQSANQPDIVIGPFANNERVTLTYYGV